MPEDLDAFRTALCTDFARMLPPDRKHEKTSHTFPSYAYAEPSDKGRYLLAVLGHFERVPDAFQVLMHGYWRDVLIRLGGAPVERNPALRQELLRTLEKRLKSKNGELVFRTDEERQRLAREAIRFGRKVQREERFISYSELEKSWRTLAEESLRDTPEIGEDDQRFYLNVNHLNRSIQYLCQREVIFQGQEWQCQTCFNRNWATIEAMTRTLACEVCGRKEPAPVSSNWHFRANPFVLDAYREHGIEAVIWTLWQLSERAQMSFYFAPSLWLWNKYPDRRDAMADAEVDLLVVVDGTLYQVEAKTSPVIDSEGVNQLVSVAGRIRPDVLLLSFMDEPNGNMATVKSHVQQKLGTDIRVELMGLDPNLLARDALLPG